MEIGKAVLLAHNADRPGLCRQLGAQALSLVPIANRPVLFHNLDALAAAGVRRVALVVEARTAPEISAAVGDGGAWGLRVQYVEAAASLDALGQLRATETIHDGEPFVVQRGDVLVSGRIEPLGDRFARDGLDALALDVSAATGHAPSPVRLARVDGKPVGGPDVVGMCFLRPEAVAGLQASARGVELDDLVADLFARGRRVRRARVAGCLPYHGDRAGLLAANRQMLERIVSGAKGAEIDASEIQGPVMVAPGAQLHGTLVRGPVIIGARARLSHAYVGPYTSIGSDAVLEAAEIEHSIVMPEAQIRFLDARLESSVIGRGARVARELRIPRVMQLLISDRAEVTLA